MTATIPATSNGRWVSVLHDDCLMVGTVVDCDPEDRLKPKRVRIQRGRLQGQVLMPAEYVLKGFLEAEEIDP